MGNDEDRGRSRRYGAEDRGWSHRSGTRWLHDREVGWHRVQSVPYTWRWGARVSYLSLKTKFDGLSMVWPQNHWDDFIQFSLKINGDGFLRFSIKTGGYDVSRFGLKIDGGFLGWGSKLSWWRVFRFRPQNWQLWFSDLCLKFTATVSSFGPQNQARYGLSVAPQNRREGDSGRHASRYIDLLRVEASRVRVFQFASRLVETRRRVVHVALSRRLRRIQVKDGRVNAMGCVKLCHLYFTVFFLLDLRDITVF
jgi:hypothetical protein